MPSSVPPSRHLLRAREVGDPQRLGVPSVGEIARAAGWSPAHFAREFRRVFGEPPHHYLLSRRLERAAALLRDTDRPVTEICHAVGLTSVGSFTSRFAAVYGMPPTAYRASFPPARRHLRIPACVAMAYGRRDSRIGEAPSRSAT